MLHQERKEKEAKLRRSSISSYISLKIINNSLLDYTYLYMYSLLCTPDQYLLENWSH